MNKNNRTIDSVTNANYLDTVGKTLLFYANQGKAISPVEATAMAMLLVECRLYSTDRDRDTLTDINSNLLREVLDKADSNTHTTDPSVTQVADEIINDLRKSGINL